MPSPDTLIAFLGIALIITFAPGPDNLMVLGQSLARGRMAGFGIAVGCALGCFTHVLWATLGVSAVLAASPAAFTALKLAGAAYLAWLGVQALRSGGQLTVDAKAAAPRPWRKDVGRGFIANAINPKVALFFLAFMPQFIDSAAADASLQALSLAGVFMALTFLVFALYGLLAAQARDHVISRPRVLRMVKRSFASMFALMGLRLALAGH